jgi:hypothetical protein
MYHNLKYNTVLAWTSILQHYIIWNVFRDVDQGQTKSSDGDSEDVEEVTTPDSLTV